MKIALKLVGMVFCLGSTLLSQSSAPAAGSADKIPASGPRTFILAGQREQFKEYCLNGEFKSFYAEMKREFDEQWMKSTTPSEPQEYGDPSPKKRTSDQVDKWRGGQVTCNRLSGVAEAATVFWIVTGEAPYLAKAKEFLLEGCKWGMGSSAHTRIEYNDEAHFRLWRKLPFVYDQIRDQLTPEEKKTVLDSFQKRGNASFALIHKETKDTVRNSLEEDAASHPIRFISMTGLAGLALYDDLPEAKEWLNYVLHFYKNQFPPWGGDDGGWGEGNAYWRGNMEHARFQDALVAIGSSQAYANPFWKKTGYFPLYFVQPYRHTAFGDTPNAGKFNLEPIITQLVLRLARRFQDGYLRAYADMEKSEERSIYTQGLYFSDERYPTGMEYLIRLFSARQELIPAAKPLKDLPQATWFRDVGWVAMHSDLGKPDEDIMMSFKSSPFASYSHSHADQNTFILNAYGENLLINSGYREYHRSPHHKGYTQRTISKNGILIDGKGQKPQSKEAKGKILSFQAGPRTFWAVGDATVGYNTEQTGDLVQEARRDVVMIDRRYFVLRDRVKLKEAKAVQWLLHAESPIQWSGTNGSVQQPKANCQIALLAVGEDLKVEVTDQFVVPVDPKYLEKSPNQSHLTATSSATKTEQVIYSVLWPAKGTEKGGALQVKLGAGDLLSVTRPDGKVDQVSWKADVLEVK